MKMDMGNIVAERCDIYLVGLEVFKHLFFDDIKASQNFHFCFIVAVAELFYIFLGKDLKPGYLERFYFNLYEIVLVDYAVHFLNYHFYSFMAVQFCVYIGSVFVAVYGKFDVKTVELPLTARF